MKNRIYGYQVTHTYIYIKRKHKHIHTHKYKHKRIHLQSLISRVEKFMTLNAL